MAQFCARCDAESLRQPAVDLENCLDIVTAHDRREIAGNRIGVNARHRAGLIGEDHIEGNQRVFHPETDSARLVIDEQHPRRLRHAFAVHQPFGARCRIVGQLHRKSCLPPVTAQLHLIGTARHRIGGFCLSVTSNTKRERERTQRYPTALSQPFTSIAMRPRSPSTTRIASASPGCTSANPERRKTSTCTKISPSCPKILAKPNPLDLSNHFMRAGCKGAARKTSGSIVSRSEKPLCDPSSGGRSSCTNVA